MTRHLPPHQLPYRPACAQSVDKVVDDWGKLGVICEQNTTPAVKGRRNPQVDTVFPHRPRSSVHTRIGSLPGKMQVFPRIHTPYCDEDIFIMMGFKVIEATAAQTVRSRP